SRQLVVFTFLSHAADPPAKRETLRMMRELACAAAPAPRESGALELQLADAAWKLRLDVPGFAVQGRSRTEQGGVELEAADAQRGILLSGFIEPVDGTPTADQCLDRYWRAALESPFEKSDVRKSRRGAMAVGEYTITVPHDGQALTDKNMNGYLGAKG